MHQDWNKWVKESLLGTTGLMMTNSIAKIVQLKYVTPYFIQLYLSSRQYYMGQQTISLQIF